MSADLPSSEELEALGATQAAAMWLERLQRDEVGDDDVAFGDWLNAHASNRLAWERARDVWDDAGEPDEDGLLDELRREALAFSARRPGSSILRYAAAALVAIGISFGAFLTLRPVSHTIGSEIAATQDPSVSRFGQSDYTTAVGQRSTFRLSDGTMLTLDTDSAVDVAYAHGLRLARLVRGQVFFEVAHDAAHPFRVAAGDRVVADLGTRFDIRFSDRETRIFLVEGSVSVSRGSDPSHVRDGGGKMLVPGQLLIVRAGQPDGISRADATQAAGWRTGLLQFDGDSLWSAVGEMNRYTKEQLVIRDPAIGALKISGGYRTGDTARFAQTLTELYPVKIVPLGDGKTEIAPKR